ncbi:hypothetical protein SELMODRAFT_417117 [Selaginella moellendorffii]|uniref:Translation initiation factor 3 N-terminal domain-containing protein n=1 Tax=Selaginella moellendorffii TaxID=88036 RepID=D8S1F3_SELML|nr:uncharacterized protein LOC9638966 [Selaginella moellendorffii]EFJ21840.1 hypothetical protein SELMODRAFT_417117 [Selaginella moellendorffii]|eukprot:XP_002977231.1 uncharacterized protein LOC9638966 [Selaginella moellendorffii]
MALWRRLVLRASSCTARRAAGAIERSDQDLQWRWSGDLLFSRSYARNTKKDDDDDIIGDPRARPNAPKGPRMNRAIADRFIRLVDSEGHKVVTREEALGLAEKQGLDLVEVDPSKEPVVCKLMDYKKEKYKEKVREKERKKTNLESRRLSDLKELQVTSKIEERDLEMKADMASKLIQRGHRLKFVVKLPNKPVKDDEGPVRSDPKALKLIDRLIELLKDVSKLEQGPQSERHRAWAILRPLPSTSKQQQQQQKGSTPKASTKGPEKPAS